MEREVETSKIDISLKPDFNLMDAFRMLDVYGKGFITKEEMVDGLRQYLGL
jgi:Ca2+-binding EF-hand superfamily protein